MGVFKKEKLNILKLKSLIAKVILPALIILNLAIFSCLLFKSVELIWSWSKEKIILSAEDEQREHLDELSMLITSIEKQLNSLEDEYKNLSSQKNITLEEKQAILEKIEELEKDGLRLNIAFGSYHQDASIKINPLHDLGVDETFNKSWLLPHKIERLTRSLTFGIFTGFLTTTQKTIIDTDLSSVRYQIEEIKKTWR